MRLLRKIFIVVFAVLLFSLIFLPPLIGWGIQQFGGSRLFFSGLQNSPVTILSYKRSWFYSDVACSVKITDPETHHLLQILGSSKPDIPDSITFIVHQHIWHGPIFYGNTIDWHAIGFALIDRKLMISPEQKKFFSSMGINDEMIEQDSTYVNFIGGAVDRLHLSHFAMQLGDMPVRFLSLQSDIAHSLWANHIRAQLVLNHFIMGDEDESITVPEITLQLNLTKSSRGLWVGDQKFELPEVVVQEEGKTTIKLNGMKFAGWLIQRGDYLDFDNQFLFDKLYLDNESLGPFKLDAKFSYLSTQALVNLVDAYQYIRHHGELYESQMQNKMLSMLPDIIIPGSALKVKSLHLQTSNGQLQLQGTASWSSDGQSPEDFDELLESLDLKGSIRISIPLLKELINELSEALFIYQLPLNDRLNLVKLETNQRTMARQYGNMMISLVKGDVMNEEDAMLLLLLVRNHVSIDIYLNQVKSLLLNRKISLDLSYLLGWQYAELYKQKNLFDQKLQQFQDNAVKDLFLQIEAYKKAGYITQNKNEYSSTFERKNTVLKMNGYEVKM